ncbi:MAG: HAMP domain-containing histidine kinase [Clostridia bacterium]|nr:HAMP domain-containing histidine kinase [Clostridia bacterium]
MEFELKFKSIAAQWFWQMFFLIAVVIIIAEILVCSFLRAINIENVRSRAADYAQQFSVLAAADENSFYNASRSYIESFEYKDKVEIEIINNKGIAFISTSGFAPASDDMPDYHAALRSASGSAFAEAISSEGEPLLCGTILLADLGNGSNGAVRWKVSLEGVNSYCLKLYLIIIAIGLAIISITAVSGRFFILSIVRPIRKVSLMAKNIAAGNFDTDVSISGNNEIGELCDSINYMANELKSADSMKNDFISSVSHELRTPLTAIRGWGETAKMSIGYDEEIVSKGLDVVLRESERLSSLVEELLDFSRMQNGALQLNMRLFSLSEVISEVADIYNELANQQKIDIEFPVSRTDSLIFGDRDRIKQVFINIIDNAIKYTEAGGQVLIEQLEEDGVARITVKDTGIGIPAQDIDRVKEKFFKSNKTVRGSGIGLAVADEIIKQHKGLLFLESTEGVGTTVTIALPVSEETDAEQAQQQ